MFFICKVCIIYKLTFIKNILLLNEIIVSVNGVLSNSVYQAFYCTIKQE